ncbi:caspase-3-like [Oscarella lobularis]|uniref:caspase-3-like n=1 Tax=Oscarella lobularis TaxID=121494 RepID=UPI0033142125
MTEKAGRGKWIAKGGVRRSATAQGPFLQVAATPPGLRVSVEDKHVDALKACIHKRETSQKIGSKLMGFTESQLDDILPTQATESETFAQMVKVWKRRQPGATVQQLVTAMESAPNISHGRAEKALRDAGLWPTEQGHCQKARSACGGREEFVKQRSQREEYVRQRSLSPPAAVAPSPLQRSASSPPPKAAQAAQGHSLSLHYPLPSDKRGKVLILNIKKSEMSSVELKGYDDDVEKLSKLFEELKFRCTKRSGLVAQKILNEMESYCRERHECAVVFVLGHGENGRIFGSDGHPVKIEKLLTFYENAETLRNKPKLLFIQACAGNQEEDRGVVAQSAGGHVTTREPITADICLAQSSCPNYRSYAYDDHSVYVKYIVEVVRKHHKEEDFVSMMTIVHDRVAAHPINNGHKIVAQMPRITSTLRKKIFFK